VPAPPISQVPAPLASRMIRELRQNTRLPDQQIIVMSTSAVMELAMRWSHPPCRKGAVNTPTRPDDAPGGSPKKASPYPSIMLMTWIIQAIATRRRAKARFGMLRLLNSRGWRGRSAVAGLKPWGSLTAHDTAPGGVLVGRLC